MSLYGWVLRFEWWLDQTARGRLGGAGVLLVFAVVCLGVASWIALTSGAPRKPSWSRRMVAVRASALRRAAAVTTFISP